MATSAGQTAVKLATWNVNSVRVRHGRLLGFLDRHGPDVLCLQELKVEDHAFPADGLRERGYVFETYGQKTYNGVAILSKQPLMDVARGFGDGDEDAAARFMAASAYGLRILCGYFPNGGEVGSEKWSYKLRWMERLGRYLAAHGKPDDAMALLGDFNVAPEDEDVARPEAWADSVLCHPEARAALARIRDLGFRDAVRACVSGPGPFTWWDYRNLGFPKNDGLRIDHVYLTGPVVGRAVRAFVDRDERKGAQPSDHAPVVVELSPC